MRNAQSASAIVENIFAYRDVLKVVNSRYTAQKFDTEVARVILGDFCAEHRRCGVAQSPYLATLTVLIDGRTIPTRGRLPLHGVGGCVGAAAPPTYVLTLPSRACWRSTKSPLLRLQYRGAPPRLLPRRPRKKKVKKIKKGWGLRPQTPGSFDCMGASPPNPLEGLRPRGFEFSVLAILKKFRCVRYAGAYL